MNGDADDPKYDCSVNFYGVSARTMATIRQFVVQSIPIEADLMFNSYLREEEVADDRTLPAVRPDIPRHGHTEDSPQESRSRG